MQSRFSLHLCQGSCLPCAPLHFLLPAAAAAAVVSPARLLTRSPAGTYISSSKTRADRPSPGSGSRRPPLLPPNVRYSPHLLPCRLGSELWAPVFNRQAFNLCSHADTSSPRPTIFGYVTLARDTTRHAIPCQYHPQWPDGPVAPVRQRATARQDTRLLAPTPFAWANSKNTTPLELALDIQTCTRPHTRAGDLPACQPASTDENETG